MPDFRRKPNRLPNYDYAQPGAYFITICARELACLFRDEDSFALTAYGAIVRDAIRTIEKIYPSIHLEKYVVMPNHLHMILRVDESEFHTSVSRVIAQMKGRVTKQARRNLFHRSFHDHVIRDEEDYLRIWTYIDNNPARWQEDCYHPKQSP